MRRLIPILALCTACLCLPAQEGGPPPRPAPEKPAPSKPFGTLRVQVATGKSVPVADALVSIEKLNRTHETGETGNVLLAWMPAGRHEVKISKDGFITKVAQVTVEADGIAVLEVQLERRAQ